MLSAERLGRRASITNHRSLTRCHDVDAQARSSICRRCVLLAPIQLCTGRFATPPPRAHAVHVTPRAGDAQQRHTCTRLVNTGRQSQPLHTGLGRRYRLVVGQADRSHRGRTQDCPDGGGRSRQHSCPASCKVSLCSVRARCIPMLPVLCFIIGRATWCTSKNDEKRFVLSVLSKSASLVACAGFRTIEPV